MDTRKLQVAPKVGQVVIVQDDEIVARLYHSDRRDNVEATEYAEELVCRWNMHEELVDTLADTLRILVTKDGLPESGKGRTPEQQRAYDRARQLLKSLDHA